MPLGSLPAALRAALVLALMTPLAAPLAPRQDTAAPADDAAAQAPSTDPWAAFEEARVQLGVALWQQRDPALWTDVAASTGAAREALAEASAAEGGPDPALVEALATLIAAVDTRQVASERRAQAQAEAAGDGASLTSVETRWTTTVDGLADTLLPYLGSLPELSVFASDLLVEAGRPAEAQRVLHEALVLWPAAPDVHAQVVAWAGRLPDPGALLPGLRRRAAELGLADPATAGRSLETAAALGLELGRRVYEGAQSSGSFDAYREAAGHFEAAAADLAESRGMPRQLDPDTLESQRAAALINAGWAQYAVAWGRWSAGEKDDEQAFEAAAAAQLAFFHALRADPGNETAKVGLSQVGTLVGTKARGDNPLLLPPEDKADIRDYFGNLAPFFEVAEWWNNHALFSRDTGEAAQAAGDLEQAMALYEQAYDSYRKAIEIEPDDARMVNDTGVMLFYYLDRDLDAAQRYFERAIELGADRIENPFADHASDVWQQELAAYLDAKLNLARLHAQQGRLDAAKAVIDGAVALDREVFEAGDQPAMRADLLQTQAQVEAALADDGT